MADEIKHMMWFALALGLSSYMSMYLIKVVDPFIRTIALTLSIAINTVIGTIYRSMGFMRYLGGL